MISKSQIKLITSLRLKKYRDAHQLFVAEGPKLIADLLASGLQINEFVATSEEPIMGQLPVLVGARAMEKMTNLKTASTHLAVFKQPHADRLEDNGLILVLDAVRDPGNLGTLIRLCDWFGVTQLVCSEDTVDCYNPKVIQATMGSIARVQIHYRSLISFLQQTNLPTFAAVMDGNPIYEETLPENAVLVLGNEANGISSNLLDVLQQKISIPSYQTGNHAESLNVATAGAILLNEFRRTTGT